MIFVIYIIFFGYSESIVLSFGNQTPGNRSPHPLLLSPKWLDQPSVSGGVRSSALSFPGNCDWPRDGHVMHSGPMRCNEAVVVASGGLADSLSVLSQRQEILGMDLSGEGGAQRPGDTRQDLVTSSKPLDPVVPETKYSLHFVVTWWYKFL